jgi:hypothetical protein
MKKRLSTIPVTIQATSSWSFLIIGILIGQNDLANNMLSTVQSAARQYLVPVYTTFVLLYLAWVAFRTPLEPILNSLRDIFTKSKGSIPDDRVPTEVRATPVVVPPSSDAVLDDQPFDLSGAFKLRSNENFEEFLAVQGVPWALRRAANQARPLHRITHQGSLLTIKIEGIIESQTTYIINGPPVETNVRGRIFEDVVSYLGDGSTGIIVRKKALSENYDVSVQRLLSEDKQRITMTSTATFRDGKDPIQCIQLFERVE